MLWQQTTRDDPRCAALADRHYSRQKIGSAQFAPPGRCLVLYAETETGSAVWVTSWPFAEWVKHAWAGAWVCSIFRNEGAALASELIRQAIAATRSYYGEPPALGLITFVKPSSVQSPNPGYCFKCAGFKLVGYAKDGKPCLQLRPESMPDACPPLRFRGVHPDGDTRQMALFA